MRLGRPAKLLTRNDDQIFFLSVQRTSGTPSIQAGCAPGLVWTLFVAQLVTFSLRVVLEGSRILDLHEFSFHIRNRTAVTVQTARCFFYHFPRHCDFVAYKSYKCRHVPDRCRARGNNDSDRRYRTGVFDPTHFPRHAGVEYAETVLRLRRESCGRSE